MNSTTTTYTTKTITQTDKGRITTIVITHVEPIEKKKPYCTRCGRNTHYKRSCFAKCHLHGHEIDD